jgi:predicted Zn-dependent protease with MMP-like domain
VSRDVGALVDEALLRAIEDPEVALEIARRALGMERSAETWYAFGVCACEAGKYEEGIRAFETALDLDPAHSDARYALAFEHFEALVFEESAAQLLALLRIDPAHPDGHWLRALVRERMGDFAGAARDYQAAVVEAPELFRLPVPLTDADISAMLDAVLTTLHPTLQRYMENVPVLVEEVPTLEVLQDLDPPGHPSELLGCFSGHSLTERAAEDPWSGMPPTITLYRRNLQRLAVDREELMEQLRVTLVHEIGHFLGLDEEALEARGLA